MLKWEIVGEEEPKIQFNQTVSSQHVCAETFRAGLEAVQHPELYLLKHKAGGTSR